MVPNSYIPVNTRCVLAGKGDDAGAWYDTRKEVDVSGAGTARCPMTGREVLVVEQKGFRLYFAPEVVRTRRANIPRMSLLNYDLPERLNIDNPSGALRRVAVRTTLSGWVVPTDRIPWMLIDELRTAGATVTLYKFDESEGESLLFAVQNALRTQIRQAAESAEASADAAAEQYANSDKPNRGRYLDQRIKTAHAAAQEKLAAYQEAAKVFGIDATTEVTAAGALANAIQVGVYVRAERYVAAVAALRAQNTATATALADAAEVNAVPVGVMADAVQEGGTAADETTAANLREAFDDEIFSLNDVA